ncbi:TetR/AcrR family transcriptional regulator [Cohnella rhizosphaerae]|uniref:TetR/AcrR family transcriptional regulator n=1 Tax=Cohnella rhizosphaerae TaxID=1457232 RepID=A0A9X4QSI6_9BACL|nr:TetR/AcrR family transcriptional regulator [Cohnella rhizosphaerae]MDG0809354.1 TetR/AcrR family transcriptional regulator [Cohnella rhizosphaerae]
MTPRDDAATATRKAQILDAAAELFAHHGFYKTTTALVAKSVGVTQPYVFHFFRTKEELFLAVLDRGYRRLVHAFSAVESPPEELAHRMGCAFKDLLDTHRNEILLLMQAYSIPEPAIRDEVKSKFDEIHRTVGNRFAQAGIPDASGEAGMFISVGLLIALSQILELPRLLPWYGQE